MRVVRLYVPAFFPLMIRFISTMSWRGLSRSDWPSSARP